MINKYGRWPESAWTSNRNDWKGQKITAGVDVGTTGAQAAVMVDGSLFGYSNIHTGCDFAAAADGALQKALGESGMKAVDIGNILATGFGSRNAKYAKGTIDEISAHSKGARFLFGPTVTTIVDLGAQAVKAIRLYDWDRVRDFKISDKCATGFGHHIEVVAELLQESITEMGQKSLEVGMDPEPVSTTCYNFAFPETLGLFRKGYKEEEYGENDVLAAYLCTIAWRALGTIGKLCPLDAGDISVHKELAFTGGLSKNLGITKRIERELGVNALESETDPALAGAIGAALLA